MVPFNLEGTLRLNHGRAFVGFTAATGRDTWQVSAPLSVRSGRSGDATFMHFILSLALS